MYKTSPIFYLHSLLQRKHIKNLKISIILFINIKVIAPINIATGIEIEANGVAANAKALIIIAIIEVVNN